MARFKLLALLLVLALVLAQDDQVTENGVDTVTTESVGSADVVVDVSKGNNS